MKVALVQLAYSDDEPVADRVERVAALVRAQKGHDLVVLPELWAPGGFSYKQWHSRAETVDGPTAQAMSAAAREAGVLLHAGSIVEQAAPGEDAGPQGRGRWNTSLVFGPDGSLATTYRKVHRFGFGEGEPQLLEAGGEIVTVDVPRPAHGQADPAVGRSTPHVSGAVTLPSDVVRLGLATCYDLRFPELFRRLLDAGAEVVLVPAAWPAARVEHWTLLGRARAIENQLFVVQVNTAGTHAGHEMGGHSQVVGPWGEVLAEAGCDEEVLSADIDVDGLDGVRVRFPVLADRRL
ncbi:MAG TPA: carbon-nitrogen family hydrolase [Actinomycetales bacterium]|nr:carbon-nitrogen family hydrolase [Actinomycetales bacterium]